MTNQQYSITPPPELVRYWARFQGYTPEALWFCIANNAAQWGWDQREPEIQAAVDQELEACCNYIHTFHGKHRADWLHDMRRLKPLSLKEQALAFLKKEPKYSKKLIAFDTDQVNIIRQALEQLDD